VAYLVLADDDSESVSGEMKIENGGYSREVAELAENISQNDPYTAAISLI